MYTAVTDVEWSIAMSDLITAVTPSALIVSIYTTEQLLKLTVVTGNIANYRNDIQLHMADETTYTNGSGDSWQLSCYLYDQDYQSGNPPTYELIQFTCQELLWIIINNN